MPTLINVASYYYIYPLQVPGITFRSGIVGIERKMQEKVDSNASNISIAFQDMKNLIDMAKDMVHLANVMSNKIKVLHIF